MEYYERLREMREDKDLTLREIADLIGTSTQYYQKYEKGKHPMPIRHQKRYANFTAYPLIMS